MIFVLFSLILVLFSLILVNKHDSRHQPIFQNVSPFYYREIRCRDKVALHFKKSRLVVMLRIVNFQPSYTFIL